MSTYKVKTYSSHGVYVGSSMTNIYTHEIPLSDLKPVWEIGMAAVCVFAMETS